MFHKLRLKLTAGSFLKILMLVAFVSGLLYMLVSYSLGFNRDQALREMVNLESNALGLHLPKGVLESGRDWQLIDQIVEPYSDDNATSFFTALDAQGQPILNLSDNLRIRPVPDLLYRAAVQAAHENGSDLRTLFASNGVHVRLLTYRLPPGAPMAYLQVGRLLADEDRIKHRLLLIFFAVGILFTVLAGGFSWLMNGRSLRPTWQAWERQQTFVANASHELRTPLTLIRVSAQVVQQGLAPDHPQRPLMDDVLSETDYMTKLLDELLLLSRLDASKLKLNLQVLELSVLLPRIQRQFAALANDQSVSIGINRAEGCVRADPMRLWEVLLILVDNALHHTPAQGTVTISSQIRDRFVQISVADTGDGIATADLPHVFERFYKANNSLADKRSAGLGLSIAKPLVELHGGVIDIDSQVGRGTRVIITLPAQHVPQIIGNSPLLEPL